MSERRRVARLWRGFLDWLSVSVKLVRFFFSSRRRHTRCSRDWSSDVCSSDLAARSSNLYATLLGEKIARHGVQCWLVNTGWTGGPYGVGQRMRLALTRAMVRAARSEERRVGKECRSRWSPYH